MSKTSNNKFSIKIFSIADWFSLTRTLLLLPMLSALPNSPKLALAWYGIMLWTDYLDGFIAKRHNKKSPFGTYLDPMADITIHGNILIYFIRCHSLPYWFGFIFFLRFIILTFSSWKRTHLTNSNELFSKMHQNNSLRSTILGKISFLSVAITIAATLSIHNPSITHHIILASSFMLSLSLLDYCFVQWKSK
jgi:phosphatidylglycerophosphate synthase